MQRYTNYFVVNPSVYTNTVYRFKLQIEKKDLILIMIPEKQDKTLDLNKHWSADLTPARNEVIKKTKHPVKSVKCNKICSNN